MSLQCNFCKTTLDNINKYIFHLEVIHKVVNYFICPYSNCNRTYDTKASFKYHYNSCHSANDLQNSIPANVVNNTNCVPHPVQTSIEFGSFNILTSNHYDSPIRDKQHTSLKDATKSCIEIFMCNLYSVVNLPRTLVQNIFELVESLCKSLISEIHKILNNDSLGAINKIKVLLEITSFVNIAFNDLNTEYKRLKYFTDKEYYLMPKEVKLGTSTERQTENNNILMTIKDSKLYMSQLGQFLKNFLELPKVYGEILSYQQHLLTECNLNETHIISNIVQGSLWQEIMATKHDSETQVYMPIILYFDDFETGNPLGSHAGQYKLGAVYVSIATIPPNKASRLENIFLTQLFYSNDRSHFGNDLVFRNLIEELKFLEEVGITINLPENIVNVKFILMAMSGDNLGLHGILGFYESFMATNFCRFCLSSKTESQTQIQESNNIRQVIDYEDDVANNVGIKATCIWNTLPNFHIYKNFTCDVMHDLMEGVHRYGMARVIKGLIDKGFISLDHLNSRIKYFKYHLSEKNRPPPINLQHLLNGAIIMSATEMLCLVRNFVFMVGDLIDVDEPIWLYYLTLLEITDILTSQTFTDELLDYLKYLISEHHEKYQNVFVSTLKPKHHFMIHYPTIIKKIGPPILVSAFKYEAKHRDLKKVAQSITSRRNLPLSVFIRCQLQQCLRFVVKKGLVDYVSHGKVEIFNDDTEGRQFYDWYKINGVTFNVNDVILYNVTENNPEYLIISKIINGAEVDEVLFDCFHLRIINYNPHFRAYKVVRTCHAKIVSYNDLYINIPSITYVINSDCYVKLDF